MDDDGSMPVWFLAILPTAFMLTVGACVGSFLNVVAHRLPRGEGLFRPGSRCPMCETPLTWRENFPILGWLWLRGRCRFCRSPVSPEYPMVEAGCALVFAGLFAAWFLPSMTGVSPPSAWAPEWTRAGLLATWPMLMLILALLSGLVGMTLIDARTFTIPLAIPTIVTCLALITHPLAALGSGDLVSAFVATGWSWTIPTPTGAWLGAAFGGGAGLALALVALRVGVITRSFADFDEWARSVATQAADGAAPPPPPLPPTLWGVLLRVLAFTGPAIALMALGMAIGMRVNQPMVGMAIGMAVGLVAGTGLRALVPEPKAGANPAGAPTRSHGGGATSADTASLVTAKAPRGRMHRLIRAAALVGFGMALGAPLGWGIAAVGTGLGLLVAVVVFGAPPRSAETDREQHEPSWLAYPHSRREMAKDVLFCAPIIALAALGAWLATGAGPLAAWATLPPAWLGAFGGSLLGLLVGGGVVWAVRILGTIAFGKEAMGLGDVHLMACVGAVLGWADPVVAFLIAPAFGLTYALIGLATRRGVGPVVALPYGPHLALATAVVIVWKPWVEASLSALVGGPVNLP